MGITRSLELRSGQHCELCSGSENLKAFVVAPKSGDHVEECIHTCTTCRDQLDQTNDVNPNHWRCLSDSMWSEIPAVQVVAWRILNSLKDEGWPIDLLDMLYLDEETKSWAELGQSNSEVLEHKDVNGVVLSAGDSVVLIKDLKVKGAGFTAKRGTAVRNITLVHDNVEHIEGKVNGQKIVILTQYLKK